MFTHVDCELPKLKRQNIDGARYYTVNGRPMVSITSVTSHWNKQIFVDWRKRIGEAEANRITRRATSRGTATHSLIENHLLNKEVEFDKPSPKMLFLQAKETLKNINNIYSLEESLYSEEFGVSGSVDGIAEYIGEFYIIELKTAEKPKPRDWIENYFVQAAAYACMFFERTGIPVKKLVIIMTCENGDVTVYEEYDKIKYMKKLVLYIQKFVEEKINECQNKDA